MNYVLGGTPKLCTQFLRITALLLAVACNGFADVSITTPTVSNSKLSSSSDYATEVLSNPWDMDSKGDLAEFIPVADYSGLTSMSFSSGLMTATVSDTACWFHLLSPGQCSTNPLGKNGQALPIDTTKYRYLSIRMYTDAASEMRVLVNTGCSYASDYWRTVLKQTFPGWRTYTFDLQTITHEVSSGQNVAWNATPATGIRIEPSLSIGAQIKVDWVTLTAEPPGSSFAPSYSVNAGLNDTLYSLYLDDNSDPFDGYAKSLVKAGSSTEAVTINSSELFPGNYKVVGYQSDDFATLQGNPWDMSENIDIEAKSGVTASVTGGAFAGVTTDNNPLLTFDTSHGATIDASTFRYLSYKMTLSAGGVSAVQWLSTSGTQMGIYYFGTSAGTNVYNIDLGAQAGWSGTVGKLRLLIQATSGVTFSLDFAALRKTGYVSSLPYPSVITSPGNLVLNSAPIIDVLQPDSKGGEDYASTVLANPWNMDTKEDISSVSNVSVADIYPNNYINGLQGDFFYSVSRAGSGDPYNPNLETKDTTKMVDASRYKNLVYKMYINKDQDVTNGSVARIIWTVNGDTAKFFDGDDQITFDGWNEYVQDMTAIELEPLIHTPGNYTNPPWYGLVSYFRVDAHEFLEATGFYFDYVRLTADDEANTQFGLTYSLSDADDEDADVSVSLYYNTTKSTTGGTLITTLPLTRNSKVYAWDTTAIPEGTYYIYASATDGYNTTTRLGTGRLVITHTRTQDTTSPVLSVDGPIEGASIYDTMTARGYALDNVQLAALEVLIDDELIKVIHPSLYNSTAHGSYPQWAEGSNAGFFERIDISTISAGAHTLQFKAYDTAGNVTSSSALAVTKVAGSDPSPAPTPTQENATPFAVTTPPTLKISANLNVGKKQIDITVKNASNCSTVGVVAATSQTDAEQMTGSAVLVKSKSNTKSSAKFTAKKLTPLKKVTKGKQIPIFIAAACNGGISGTATKFYPTKLTKGKVSNTAAKWISGVLKKNLK